jgi:hypothetical protein
MGEVYMDKANLTKHINRFIIFIIGVYVIYSIYIHLEYRNYVKQSIVNNYDIFGIISFKGNNLTNRLEEFVQLSIEKEKNPEVRSKLYNNWRIINGETKDIYSYLFALSTKHMGDDASDWDLLQYSLFRVDNFISGLTNKFLEHHAYAISSEEREKLEAVITVFRTISEEKDNELVDIQSILQSIKEPMIIIDDNYSDTLEGVGR